VGAVAPQIGHQHSVAVGGQSRRNLVVGAHVVREAVQKDHRRAVGRAVLLIGDVEDVGADGFAVHLLNI
jgi:hypothetical protein